MKRKKNVILEKVTVQDYAAEGKSLARVDGKVIFIENAVPGDVVDLQVLKSKKDWAEARAIRFEKYSDQRVTPFCQHFGICGGCQWQMLPYEKQLEYKHRQVIDQLTRISHVNLPEARPILGAQQTTRYRNKIEYTFGNKRFLLAEELNDPSVDMYQDVAGYHIRGMFDKLIDIQTCHLQAEPTNAVRLAVKDFAIRNQFSFYDIRNHVGLMRTMQVRLCETGELMVNIVFGEDEMQKIERMMEFVKSQFPSITTLLYTINLKKNDSLHDLEPVVYTGPGYIKEKLTTTDGIPYFFKIGPKSFFQTNTKQGERLYQVTSEFAGLTGSETVYDLYCGTGSIGIFLSGRAKKIIGVEMIAEAVADAKENAALNGISDATFIAGDVIEICNDEFFSEHGRPDVVITDPPRAGMHASLVTKLLEMESPLIVYVSCNPATQARDLALLDAKYEVTAIQPVDMFPHTLHIENVAQLKLRNSQKPKG